MAMIHMVRHGKAAAGFGAHKDPGLDELGHRQANTVAQMLVELLSEQAPLKIFSSPLARAFETAQPLAKLWQGQIILEPRIAEVPSPTQDLAQRAAWLSQAMAGTWGELGAPLKNWRDSLVSCLLDIDEDCVMFSHYVAINAAVGAAQDSDLMRVFAPDNCSVTTLNNDSQSKNSQTLQVVTLGRTAATKIN